MTSALRLALLGLCLAACTAPTTPTGSPDPSVSPGPTPSATTGTGFYLRAWFSQSLPPEHTFAWMPVVTVYDGTLLDGNVAVPAIFPGPLMIAPNARPISEAGIVAISTLAADLGLLGETTDFTGGEVAPGSRLGQMALTIEGNRRVLLGDPELPAACDARGCDVDPGTPEAFAAFWQQLTSSPAWLESELGNPVQYVPERVALLLTSPLPAEPGLSPVPVEWPLETSLAASGVELPGTAGLRCVTLQGAELDVMLPILTEANQLTVFVDDEDTVRSAVVRVLVPEEDSPCPD